MGSNGSVDLLHFVHQCSIDMQTPRSVDDQDVVHAGSGPRQRGAGNRDRVIAGHGWRKEIGLDLRRKPLKLQNSGGTAHIGADQQNALLVGIDQPARQLARRRGLARPLQTR